MGAFVWAPLITFIGESQLHELSKLENYSLRSSTFKYYEPGCQSYRPDATAGFESAFALRPFGIIGSDRNRMPLALNIPFPMAGAIPINGVSPAPAEGRSLRSTRTISMIGMSLKRGTRYC